ncbi:MAG: GDSL-type esterase/lipase family protein [Pseudobdellovibrionaceae bacterium]
MVKNRSKLFCLTGAAFCALVFCFIGYKIAAYRSHIFDEKKNLLLRNADIERDMALSVKGCTVFLGDSQINMGQWSEYFPNLKICERGYNGITSAELLPIAERLAKDEPKEVFLLVGINDIMKGVPYEKISLNILEIADLFADKNIRVHVITPLRSVKYGKIDMRDGAEQVNLWFQKNIKQGGHDKNMIFFNGYSRNLTTDDGIKPELTVDGVHLNGAGYAVLADNIRTLAGL